MTALRSLSDPLPGERAPVNHRCQLLPLGELRTVLARRCTAPSHYGQCFSREEVSDGGGEVRGRAGGSDPGG